MKYPENWIKVQIGDVATVVSGGTPKSGNPENFELPGKGIAWLTPADLSGYIDKYITHGNRDLTEIGYKSSSAKIIPPGSIVFSSRAPIGYLAIAKGEISTNQGFKNFVLPSLIDSSFAYYSLKSIKSIAESLGTGTTFREISSSSAKTLPFLLIPLAEQKVIAEKLDDMLAKVERIKARLERIPQILKQFRQSVLADAVSGRLTAHWRKVHLPVKINVKTISDRQFQLGVTHGNFGKKLDRARDILTDELSLVTQHTEGWPLIRIGSLCSSVVPNRDKPKSFSGGFHWLLTPHFADQSIWIDYTKIESGLSEDEVEEFNAKVIKQGNVIMTCVGRVGLSAVLEEDAVINQQIHAFLVNEHITPEYLAYCIRANFKYYESQSTSTTVSYLNKTSCNSLPIPLPTIEEQKEIARRVEQLFTYAANIEKQVVSSLEKVNRLSQAILSKAFRGELSEKWRTENPNLIIGENSAEALLAKIKAEIKKK